MNKLLIGTLMFLSFTTFSKTITCPTGGKPIVNGLDVMCEFSQELVTKHTGPATCSNSKQKVEIYKGEAMCVRERRNKTVIKNKARCKKGDLDKATGICTWVDKEVKKTVQDSAVLK